ncbi:MAG: peptidylprolyl isomerase [Cytophagaceae bacterium]|nr:peptidylprolyl isomerase [Cytophagaceae bacterium]
MKKRISVVLIILLAFQACKETKTSKTTAPTDPVIATIGTQPIYNSEFAYVYNKNNANAPDAFTDKSVKDYLRLYINFKLKVKEAEQLGLDTAKGFKKELEGYMKQLAQPYFTEKSVTEKPTKEAYERMKEEINASHILIKLSQDADPKDTLAAYNRIKEIKDKVVKGESFEKLAQDYSDDPSAKRNKGNLGYFTAFGTIYPFESAAYNTPVGSISNPVRTQFGYHIIKVNDRRKSQGKVKVAHIMVRATEGMSAADSIAAKQKIEEIYQRATVQKEDWGKLVSQFSEDANSKSKGGELMEFSAGKMIPTFEEASFALQKPGDISKPVLTPYGWHIIKLIERKQLEPFETLEPTIKQKVSKDRGEINKKALLERLKKENNFAENTKAAETSVAMADSSLLAGAWTFKTDEKNNPVLFSIGTQKFTQTDFFNYVKQKQRVKRNISAQQYMRTLYKDYTEESLLLYEEAHLEEKYQDYRMLVREYRDGILLFQLMDEKVWSKAIEDTAGLKKYFSENRDKYKWDYRAHTKIFSVSNQDALTKLKEELTKDKFAVKDYSREILFTQGKADITSPVSAESNPAASPQRILDNVIHDMNKNKSYIIQITASADATEGIKVAQQRARAIQAYLIENGIDSARTIIVAQTGAKGKKEKDKVADRKATIAMFTKSPKELEKHFNANAPLTLQVSEGVFQKGENEIVNNVEWREGNYTAEKDGRIYYILITKVEEPRLKTFEESRGLVISDYQSYLEQKWIEELRAKYPVVVNDAEVQKLVKQ